MMATRAAAIATGLVLGIVIGSVVNGQWGLAGGLLVGYLAGCVVMYATVQSLRREERERMARRERYGSH